MKKRLHVVFLEFVTQFGGAPRSTLEFAKRLSDEIEVTIIDPYGCCSEYREAALRMGLRYLVLLPQTRNTTIGCRNQPIRRFVGLLVNVVHLWRLSRLAIQEVTSLGGDVVIGNNPKSLLLVALSWRLRRLPLIGYMRGWYTPEMMPPHARWLYGTRCHHLFAVSRSTLSALVCTGLAQNKISVLHNPIDFESLRRAAKVIPANPIPQISRQVKILLPGSLVRAKGQHTAIRALAKLVERGFDAVLWLAGDVGLGEDQNYVTEMKELTRQLGVHDRVEWLGLSRNLPYLIEASDVVILPSYSEGLPRVILEAMCLSRPVVATPVGGVTDLILHTVTGMLHEVDDDYDLAGAVERVLQDSDFRNTMIATARKFVENQFRPEDHTSKALKHFSKVCLGKQYTQYVKAHV